jgi:biofilm PGA synthesis N-glycosyltransferase PgaC
MSDSPRYVVISPVRNEAEHLRLTIDSMAAQTLRPLRWVIVNDGSTDGTDRVARDAAERHPWIIAVDRPDRGFRKAGGGVVEAFYEGYRTIEGLVWAFLIKLDGDVSFDPDYFRKCLEQFDRDPHLGIGGGTVCCRAGGLIFPEAKNDPMFHVRGATKIYRRACWEGIGGLIQAPGWDTLDEVKANMMHWTTRTFPEIRLLHHRPTGGAYGAWSDRVKNGTANYIAGYHPLFMFLKCVKRMTERPYLVGSCGLLFGFIKGYLTQIPQVEDRDLIRYFRQQQINRLLGRKSLWG